MTSENALIVFVVLVFLVFLVVAIGVQVFFLLSLHRALERCAPENRELEPGKVWLCFIPFFNLVWIFIVVSRVSRSLSREFQARHALSGGDCGRAVGLAYCILAVTSIIPYLGILTGLAGFVCWIVYWVKIAGYSRTLAQAGPLPGGGPVPAEEAHPPVEEPFNPGRAWLVLAILVFAWYGHIFQSGGPSMFQKALQDQFSISNQQLGWLFMAHSYGLIAGYVLMTIITALWGTRWSLVVALAGASLAAAGTSLASGAGGLIVARVLLGLFGGALLPAAIQSMREYFHSQLRPLVIGLLLALIELAWLIPHYLGTTISQAMSWRTMYVVSAVPTAIAAVLCGLVWQPRQPSRVSSSVSSVAIVSVVMVGLGVLLVAPFYAFTTSELPYFISRDFGSTQTDLWPIGQGAGAFGAFLAGLLAWVMMRSGVSAWKSRAVLFVVFGALFPLAILGIGLTRTWTVIVVLAVVAVAYDGWGTLFYSAVADTLPARGVVIGAAVGELMSGLVWTFIFTLSFSLVGQHGFRFVFGIWAAVAVVGLLSVALLAWLVRPKQAALPAAANAGA